MPSASSPFAGKIVGIVNYIREDGYDPKVLYNWLTSLSFTRVSQYIHLLKCEDDVLDVFLPILKDNKTFTNIRGVKGLDVKHLGELFERCHKLGLTFESIEFDSFETDELEFLHHVVSKYPEVTGKIIFVPDDMFVTSLNLEATIQPFLDQLREITFLFNISGAEFSNHPEKAGSYDPLMGNIRFMKEMGLKVKVSCPHPLVPNRDFLNLIGFEDGTNAVDKDPENVPSNDKLFTLSDDEFMELIDGEPKDKYVVARHKLELLLQHYIGKDDVQRVSAIMDTKHSLKLTPFLQKCETPCLGVMETLKAKIDYVDHEYTNWVCPDNAEYYFRHIHKKNNKIKYNLDSFTDENTVDKFHRFVELSESFGIGDVFSSGFFRGILDLNYGVNVKGYHQYIMTVLKHIINKGRKCETIFVNVFFYSNRQSLPVEEILGNLSELSSLEKDFKFVCSANVTLTDSKENPVKEILDSDEYREFLKAHAVHFKKD